MTALFDTHSIALTQITADIANQNSGGILLDADWRFGVTVSTDDVGRVGTTFMQMRLLIDEGKGGAQDQFVELNVSQFFTLLSQLEKAQTLMSLGA